MNNWAPKKMACLLFALFFISLLAAPTQPIAQKSLYVRDQVPNDTARSQNTILILYLMGYYDTTQKCSN